MINKLSNTIRILLFIVLLNTPFKLYAQYNFYKIEYYYNPVNFGNTGKFHFYKIRLESDGKGKIVYSIKSDSGHSEAFINDFTISEESKNEINRIMNDNKIIETENQFSEDKDFENLKETEFAKISYSNVISDSSMKPVVLKTMSTPLFPKEGLKERLKVFYEKINASVPEDIWTKIRNAKGKN